mgnify:CR=1 FL=1
MTRIREPNPGRPASVAPMPAAYRPRLVRDRAGLVREVRAAWEELDGVVRGLSESELDRQVPGLGEGADTWTVKDVVAHLAAWRRNAARVATLQALPTARRLNALPGAVLGLRTPDFNADLLRRWRSRTAAEVLEEHRESFETLVAALDRVPEERLLIRKRSVLWLTPAIGHPRVHLGDIRAAIEG